MDSLLLKAALINLFLLFLLKVIALILGFGTIRLGHDLISQGAKGEFKFKTSVGGVKADLTSVSPGLLFVLLGVLLIGYAVYVNKVAHVSSTSTKAPAPTSTVPDVPLPTN
jgi:hypothetical protein